MAEDNGGAALGRPRPRHDIRLTARQREIVQLIAQGYSNVEIAERLGISARTAKAHSDTLRTKLRVSKRRQIPAAFRALTGEDPHSLSGVAPGRDSHQAHASG